MEVDQQTNTILNKHGKKLEKFNFKLSAIKKYL